MKKPLLTLMVVACTHTNGEQPQFPITPKEMPIVQWASGPIVEVELDSIQGMYGRLQAQLHNYVKDREQAKKSGNIEDLKRQMKTLALMSRVACAIAIAYPKQTRADWELSAMGVPSVNPENKMQILKEYQEIVKNAAYE